MNGNNKAGKSKWLILVAMTLSLSMILVDQGVSPITLPHIQSELGISGNLLYWVINAYLLAFAVTAACGGSLGDIFGRVKALVFGVVLFAVSTAFSGIAWNAVVLIVARACQGIGAAFFVTASAAIINTNFEPEERGKAMAYYNSFSTILMGAGTLLGGAVIDWLSWRWAYWINIPVAAFVVLAVLIFRPKDEVDKSRKVDAPGLGLLMVSLTSVILAVQQVGNWGWSSGWTLGLFFGGALLFTLFVRFERRVEQPLINFRLLGDRSLAADVTVWGLVQFVSFGAGMFGSLYLQQVLAFSPTVTSAWSIVTLVVVAASSQFGGRLYDKHGARRPIIIGAVCLIISYLSQAPVFALQNIYFLIPGIIIAGAGFGLLMTAVYTDAMNRTAPDFRGQASGVMETIGQIGGTLGIAVCSALVSLLQINALQKVTANAGIALEKAEEIGTLISDSADMQQAKASVLTADWQNLVSGVKLAVAQSYAWAYYLAGALMVVALVVVIVALRNGRYIYEEEHPEEANG